MSAISIYIIMGVKLFKHRPFQHDLYSSGKLKETLPLDRAQMRIKVTCPVKMVNKVKKLFKKLEGWFRIKLQ